MEAILYPLAASKMLRHCEIFLSNMREMNHEELVELSFNEFIASADRTIQYLHKEINEIGGEAPAWFKNRRDNIPNINLFYQLRHIIAHHFFIPLTPIILIEGEVPKKDAQISEYRLDLEMLPKDKKFDKQRSEFIRNIGSSINAITLCSEYFDNLTDFVKEAEEKYGNKIYFLRNKIKSKFRVNHDLTLAHFERAY
jgi:hypothetical protein